MSDTSKNRYTYVPPHVQKAMAQHIGNANTPHLSKYAGDRVNIPQHAERAMSKEIQNSLPSHLKQYGDAYLQQNILDPNIRKASTAAAARSNPVGRTFRPRYSASRPNIFVPDTESPPEQPAQSTASQAPPDPDNPYGFILDPPKQPKKAVFGGNSKMARAMAIGGVMLVLIIVSIFASSALNSSNNDQKARLIEVAQTQNEIVRIAESTTNKVSGEPLISLVQNTSLSTQSSLNELSLAINKRGQKADRKLLGGGQNKGNDQLLTEAEQNSRFNEVYVSLLKKQLEDYKIQLESANAGGDKNEKEVLSRAYDQANILLDQLETIQ
jgi:hypothetical protein